MITFEDCLAFTGVKDGQIADLNDVGTIHALKLMSCEDGSDREDGGNAPSTEER